MEIDKIINELYEAGFSDTTISLVNGEWYFEFPKEANTQAIVDRIANRAAPIIARYGFGEIKINTL
jgi:hypothetical protein